MHCMESWCARLQPRNGLDVQLKINFGEIFLIGRTKIGISDHIDLVYEQVLSVCTAWNRRE